MSRRKVDPDWPDHCARRCTAEAELVHGKSPAMKTMAKQIIATQKQEIAQFDQWLAKQK